MLKDIDRQRAQIYSYGVVVFLFWMALNLFVPTFPIYLKTHTNNLAVIGAVISMYGLCGAIIRLPIGIVADWLGRCKPFILAGIVLAGLGTWLMGSAHDVAPLFVGRAITGLAAGVWVLLLVFFSKFFPSDEAVKATSILTGILTASRLVASLLTGWLNDLGGYPLAFFLSTGISGLALLLFIPIREMDHPFQRPSLDNFGKLLVHRDVLVPSLLNIIGQYVMMASVWGFMPILAQSLGASNVMVSLLVSANVILIILGNLTATTFTRHDQGRDVVMATFVLMALGLGFTAVAPSLTWIFIAQACIGFAIGISYPLLMGMSIEQVSKSERSTAMGLHQSIYGIGLFAGPWLSGILAKTLGIQSMFGITAISCLVLGILGTRWLGNGKADSRSVIE